MLYEKQILEKPTSIKIFEYSQLGKELKGQTDIAKDQFKLLKYQRVMLLIQTKKMMIIERKI